MLFLALVQPKLRTHNQGSCRPALPQHLASATPRRTSSRACVFESFHLQVLWSFSVRICLARARLMSGSFVTFACLRKLLSSQFYGTQSNSSKANHRYATTPIFANILPSFSSILYKKPLSRCKTRVPTIRTLVRFLLFGPGNACLAGMPMDVQPISRSIF